MGTLFTGKSRLSYNQIVEGVLARMNGQELRQLAGLYNYDLNNAADRAKLAEEHLARVAEQPGKLPDWASRVIAKVRDLLRKLYPNLKFSEADVRELLRAARKRLQTADPTDQANPQRSGTQAVLDVQDLLKSLKPTPEKLSELNQRLRAALVESGESPGLARDRIAGMLVANANMRREEAIKLAEKAIKQCLARWQSARLRIPEPLWDARRHLHRARGQQHRQPTPWTCAELPAALRRFRGGAGALPIRN